MFTLYNSQGSKVFLPIESVLKGDDINQCHQQYPANNQTNPCNLEVGSMVLYGNPPWPCPGVIKWLGYLPKGNALMAGVEMVSWYLNDAGIYSSVVLKISYCNTCGNNILVYH